MPIPDFNSDGLLPQGFHSCDEASFRQAFVDNFPHMPKRGEIYRGFSQFKTEMEGHGVSANKWIDGSYVENNKEPSDVDVLVIIRYDHLNNLSAPAQQHLSDCFRRGNDSKLRYYIDCYLLPWFPPGHQLRPWFEEKRSYWADCFGNSRGTGYQSRIFRICGPPKGIIEMIIGDPNKSPPVHM